MNATIYDVHSWPEMQGVAELVLRKTLQPQQTNLDTNKIFAFVENAHPWMFYCSIGIFWSILNSNKN
ncbi:hypothetical protein OUZ56_004214 [Daphnia magna]|uniref:Uncharacterized protein n=1 Tax=Daphnia magna TaxID=35525 RepID=A0ABQ9YP37_9CRUS|nr:hypothetical protein OUZ56_004214 [Daphnia magna]